MLRKIYTFISWAFGAKSIQAFNPKQRLVNNEVTLYLGQYSFLEAFGTKCATDFNPIQGLQNRFNIEWKQLDVNFFTTLSRGVLESDLYILKYFGNLIIIMISLLSAKLSKYFEIHNQIMFKFIV